MIIIFIFWHGIRENTGDMNDSYGAKKREKSPSFVLQSIIYQYSIFFLINMKCGKFDK